MGTQLLVINTAFACVIALVSFQIKVILKLLDDAELGRHPLWGVVLVNSFMSCCHPNVGRFKWGPMIIEMELMASLCTYKLRTQPTTFRPAFCFISFYPR